MGAFKCGNNDNYILFTVSFNLVYILHILHELTRPWSEF